MTSKRLGLEVNVNAPRKSIGDDKRRASKVVRTRQWMHTTFEVTVATEDRRDNEIRLLNRSGDCFIKLPGVTNASGTAIAR